MLQGAGAAPTNARKSEKAREDSGNEGFAMHAHAGRGLCCAADRRFALERATGGRAGADAGAAKRDPLELPLRFHGELFWRAEGRQRSDAMSERQCREALLRLSAGGEGGHAGAAAKPPAPKPVTAAPAAPATLRFASSPSADSACRCDTPGYHAPAAVRPPQQNQRRPLHRRRPHSRSRRTAAPAAKSAAKPPASAPPTTPPRLP